MIGKEIGLRMDTNDELEDLVKEAAHTATNIALSKVATSILSACAVPILVLVVTFIVVIIIIGMLNGSSSYSSEGMRDYYVDKTTDIYSDYENEQTTLDEKATQYVADNAKDYQTYYYKLNTEPDNWHYFFKDIVPYIDQIDDGVSNITLKNWNDMFTLLLKYDDDAVPIPANTSERWLSQTDTYTYYNHTFTKTVTPNNGAVSTSKPTSSDETTTSGSGDTSTRTKITYNGVGSFKQNGVTYYTWDSTTTISDVETTEVESTAMNVTALNDPIYRISWEEVYQLCSLISEIDNAEYADWEDDVSRDSGHAQPTIKIKSRLTKKEIRQFIDAMKFTMVWNFNPASDASNKYLYKEMENNAYTYVEEGTEVPHGTETDDTADFTFSKKKIPVEAPAYAYNTYMLVEYDYNEGGFLVGRNITIDAAAFVDMVCEIFDIEKDAFYIDLYVDGVKSLPGSQYDTERTETTGEVADLESRDMHSICGKMNLLLDSYFANEPFSYYEYYGTDFLINGTNASIQLGTSCTRKEYNPNANGNLFDGFCFSNMKFDLSQEIYQPISSANAMIQWAEQWVGNPYVWGGNSLTNGIDCSHFVTRAYEAMGLDVGGYHTSGNWYGLPMFTAVPPANAQPGDIIHHDGHVALVVSVDQSKGTVTTVEAKGSKWGICHRIDDPLSNWDYALHYTP